VTRSSELELSTSDSIREIGESAWSRLVGADPPPFLSFDWLDALEHSGAVRPERGWMPCFLSVRQQGQLAAAAPAYLKGNSEGEFVFDFSWARFAEEKLGLDYYPKLIVAVPFTPATGPRWLIDPDADRGLLERAFAGILGAVVKELGLSSAHVLFLPGEQARAFGDAGLVHRAGVQFHWTNAGYRSFDDFLARFGSKRRNQIRRERRELERQGTRLELLTGADITEEIADTMFEFYRSTVQKFYWGRQYLNQKFFREVCARMPERIHVVLARDAASGRAIAGAFNLIGGGALYGRYWGAREERPFLHFNVCYYAGIEDAIRRGLRLFEPGAGGEHKLARGFEPTLTHSVHYLADRRFDRAVRDFVVHEREALTEHVEHGERVLKAR
jgi:uncharacterized protein